MLIGKDFGGLYTIDKELGSGAMGTVYRAKHKNSGDRVAIKLMSPALGSSETALARFKREVDILKQLDHPNIVKYKGSGRYLKSPFYIMEYVEGESIDHVLHRRGRLSWEELIEIGVHLCAALQHAHDRGIIHRDLKPSNLMMLKDGTVKLTDFGIAKDTDVTALTAANSTVGTAAYMSPEQCRGLRDLTHKSDLYSMGIVFYELLTGRKPFVGETAMEVFLQHANKTDYKRPSQLTMEAPIWLDTLICQLMEKDPEKRPFSASMVADSLLKIKEKVEAQKSAGVEAVSKRRIDRTSADQKLDEEDKEIGRTMLGKKKKKKKERPIYTKGWFTLTAVAAIAFCFGAFLYLVFLKAPSAESLYREAEKLMKSDDPDNHLAARNGPLADFLYYHKEHEKAGQIQAWADQADFELRDKQMHNRRNAKRAINDKDSDAREEQLARDALDEEDLGKLADAAKLWSDLSKKKGDKDADLHKWGVVGDRYLQELKKVDEVYSRLQHKIREERTLKQPAKASDDHERVGLSAVRHEMNNDLKQARADWDDLKSKHETPRRWSLLARKRVRELTAEIEASKK